MAEKSRGGSQLSSMSSDYSVLDFTGKETFGKVGKCVKSAINQAVEEDGILQKWRDFDPGVPTQQPVSTRSSYGAQVPRNLSEEGESSIAHNFKPLKARKRTYAEISKGCNRRQDSTSAIRNKGKMCGGRNGDISEGRDRIPEISPSERKKMKYCGDRPLLKRPYGEISKDRNRIPEISSPERKKRKICGDRLLLKRPYGEISKDGDRIPDTSSPERKKRKICGDRLVLKRPYVGFPAISSPDRKWRRTIMEVKDAERPSTSKEAPTTEIKRRKWKAIAFPSETRTSDSTRREVVDRKVPKTVPKIWIIGSSYIRRAEEAAYENFGENFGLDAKVEWFGKGGLRWQGVLPRFYAELSNTESPPDILVVHAGGNDLGVTPAKTLASMMEKDLMRLHAEFPSMIIVYSCINERQAWRHGPPAKVNQNRKTVNTSLRRAVGSFGGEVIEHPSLRYWDTDIFLPDGVHFTRKGNGVFMTSIHCVLMRILRKCFPRDHS